MPTQVTTVRRERGQSWRNPYDIELGHVDSKVTHGDIDTPLGESKSDAL